MDGIGARMLHPFLKTSGLLFLGQLMTLLFTMVDGYPSGCIMTYGQTGSGKTFTMSGDSGNYQVTLHGVKSSGGSPNVRSM